MADSNKKYYWLKLKEDFFRDKAIKKLRKIAGGDTYVIIYLKLMLLSLKDDGKLYFDGIEQSFESELALELDEAEDNVQVAIQFLKLNGMLEIVSPDEYLLTGTPALTGSETQAAARVRKHRQKQIAQAQALQCNTDVTPCNAPVTTGNGDVTNCNGAVTKRNTEIEKELEKELEKDCVMLTHNACPEPEAASGPPPTKPPNKKFTEYTIPLVTNDAKTGRKHEYRVSQEDFEAWVRDYPGVDVPQALRMMRQWTLSNPTRAKTESGVRKFITNWLGKEQNRARPAAAPNGAANATRAAPFDEQEERRAALVRAKGILANTGPEAFEAFCKEKGLDPKEVKLWITKQL